MGELINITGQISDFQIPQAIARDTEFAAADAAHVTAPDPHSQYLTQTEGDGRYRQSSTAETFTPSIKNISTSSSSINSNAPANQCGLEVRGTDSSAAAFMSFHRPGIWAAHFGLDTDNKFKVGGWSMGSVAYEILHDGNFAQKGDARYRLIETSAPFFTAVALPTATLAGNSIAVSWNSVQPGLGIAELCNYSGLGGGDAFNFFRLPGNASATPTISNRVSRIDITGAYIQSSDRRMKKNFKASPGLSAILGLAPTSYDHFEVIEFDSKSTKLGKVFANKIGFIAQEVQKVLPQAVPPITEDGELYGIDYACITACLVQAIQDLNKEVESLKKLVNPPKI